MADFTRVDETKHNFEFPMPAGMFTATLQDNVVQLTISTYADVIVDQVPIFTEFFTVLRDESARLMAAQQGVTDVIA
jgi:hypothetical protein